MTWARLDDDFYSHPKVLAAGNAGAGLYAKALSYCSRYLTDGRVPGDWAGAQVTSEDTVDLLSRLTDVGLWEPVAAGFVIPDYLEFNPSREDVLRLRTERAEAGRRGGLRSGQVRRDEATAQALAEATAEATASTVDASTIPAISVQNEATAEATAEAKREANAKQNRTPYPVQQLLTNERAGSARADKPRSAVDQSKPPDGLSPEMAAQMGPLLAVLERIQRQRGGAVPTPRGLGLTLLRYPQRDHLAVAHDLEFWALAGKGRATIVKDWVRTYASFLGREVDGATPRTKASHGGRPHDESDEALERALVAQGVRA